MAQTLGKTMREIKKALNGITEDIKDTITTPPDSKTPGAEPEPTTEDHWDVHSLPYDDSPEPVVQEDESTGVCEKESSIAPEEAPPAVHENESPVETAPLTTHEETQKDNQSHTTSV